MLNIRKFLYGLGIIPKTTSTADTAGEMEVLDSDNRLRFHDGTSAKLVTLNNSTDTLTNKTINADNNTITNIDNNEIKANAAIDATKIADGSVSNTEYQYLDGATGNIQGQIDDIIDGTTPIALQLDEDHVFIGDASNVSAQVDTNAVGDISADSTTGLNIKSGVIVNADINASAAIDATKIADGSVTNTEFQYIGGLTSDAQTQLNAKLGTTLNSANIFVGNGSNVATGTAVTGDISIDNAGVTAIASGVIVNADINASAAIDATKLADGSVTNAEFQYLGGVTSDIQTQLNGKQPLLSNFTANRVLFGDGTNVPATSADLTFNDTTNALTVASLLGVGGTPTVPVDITTTNATANLRITDSVNGARILINAGPTSLSIFNNGGNGTIGTTTDSDLFFDTNNTNRIKIENDGNVGIGTSSPPELLSIEGVTALRETTAPTQTANYGKIYVKSSDSNLYFMNDSGAETQLNGGGGGGDVTGPGSSTDNGLVLFNGTGGDTIKQATGTGYVKATSGVASFQATPIPVADGGTGTTTAFTAGSVVFAGSSGVYNQDNSNLFFDNTNNRLGVGTATPGATLVTNNNASTDAPLVAQDNGTQVFAIVDGGQAILGSGSPTGAFEITKTNATANLRITDSTNGARIQLLAGSVTGGMYNSGGQLDLNTQTNHGISISPNGTQTLIVSSAGAITIGASGGSQQHSLNTAVGTNGSGTATITNLPAGVTTTPHGYIQISINGTTSYMPYWR